jgi:hypothetical protein
MLDDPNDLVTLNFKCVELRRIEEVWLAFIG